MLQASLGSGAGMLTGSWRGYLLAHMGEFIGKARLGLVSKRFFRQVDTRHQVCRPFPQLEEAGRFFQLIQIAIVSVGLPSGGRDARRHSKAWRRRR